MKSILLLILLSISIHKVMCDGPVTQAVQGIVRDLFVIPKFAYESPSITGIRNFNAVKDCESIHKAIRGLRTDEKVINEITTTRNLQQRLDIAITYESLYNKMLIDELADDSSGHYKEILKQMYFPWYATLAKKLMKAVKGMGTDELELIHILCTYDNDAKRMIISTFEIKFEKSVYCKVNGDTSGEFKDVLLHVCLKQQPETQVLSYQQLKQEATVLQQSNGNEFKDKLKRILISYSRLDLKAIFWEYRRLTNNVGLTVKIDQIYKGDAKTAYKTIVEVTEDKALYWAAKIYECLHAYKDFAVRDNKLIEKLTTHCDVDLHDIAIAYYHQYNITLTDDLKAKLFNGDYKNIVVMMVQGNWRETVPGLPPSPNNQHN